MFVFRENISVIRASFFLVERFKKIFLLSGFGWFERGEVYFRGRF